GCFPPAAPRSGCSCDAPDSRTLSRAPLPPVDCRHGGLSPVRAWPHSWGESAPQARRSMLPVAAGLARSPPARPPDHVAVPRACVLAYSRLLPLPQGGLRRTLIRDLIGGFLTRRTRVPQRVLNSVDYPEEVQRGQPQFIDDQDLEYEEQNTRRHGDPNNRCRREHCRQRRHDKHRGLEFDSAHQVSADTPPPQEIPEFLVPGKPGPKPLVQVHPGQPHIRLFPRLPVGAVLLLRLRSQQVLQHRNAMPQHRLLPQVAQRLARCPLLILLV